MRLLVVTPTLGASPWLIETVASVTACAPGAVHVLVAPEEKRQRLRAEFPGTEVVADPGGGMYAAINAGLSERRDWDVFTYINDDDFLLPGFAEARAAAGLERVAYGVVELVDERGRDMGPVPVSRFPRWNGLLYRSGIEAIYQHGTIIGRDVWRRAGAFDAGYRLCGDSEWFARAALLGCPFVFRRSRVAAFRLRSQQMSRNEAAMMAEAARMRAGLGPRPSRCMRWAATGLFRAGNLPLYLKRVFAHGLLTSREIQRKS